MIYSEWRLLALALTCVVITACGGSDRGVQLTASSQAPDVLEESLGQTASKVDTGEVLTITENTILPVTEQVEVPDIDTAQDVGVELIAVTPVDALTIEGGGDNTDDSPDGMWWRPKASENLKWQWQLQGKIDTTLPVQVYNIDIEVPQETIDELRSKGIKLICYFSAGTVEDFRDDADQFPLRIIGEQYEDLVDERWVDYAEMDAIAHVMRARLDKCKSKGFDAVEIDNVDAHNYETRDALGNVTNIGTSFKMTLDESTEYVLWLADEAHKRGLGIGLKNAEEMVADVVDVVDWMLVEDCYYDSWCMAATAFIDADKPVFMAEYDDLVPDFTPACELAKSLGYSAIWRDSSLATRLYLACE